MTFLANKISLFSMVTLLSLSALPAIAGNIVYQPQNPAIFPDAPPGGGAALLASTVRPADPNGGGLGAGGLTEAEVIKQSVLGQISTQINNEIFNGVNPQGTFALGDGSTVSYVRNGGLVTITFTSVGGQQTVITVPARI